MRDELAQRKDPTLDAPADAGAEDAARRNNAPNRNVRTAPSWHSDADQHNLRTVDDPFSDPRRRQTRTERTFVGPVFWMIIGSIFATLIYGELHQDQIRKSLTPTFAINSPWGMIIIDTPWGKNMELAKLPITQLVRRSQPKNATTTLAIEPASDLPALQAINIPIRNFRPAPTAGATVHKCKLPDGSTSFQDTACPTGSTSTIVVAQAPPIANTMTLIGNEYHQFSTNLTINGVTVRGQIDTGASWVTMSAATARALKITAEGRWATRIQTANGIIPTVNKIIPIVKVGTFDLYNVEVAITPDSPTLIGMSALSHLKFANENGYVVLSTR